MACVALGAEMNILKRGSYSLKASFQRSGMTKINHTLHFSLTFGTGQRGLGLAVVWVFRSPLASHFNFMKEAFPEEVGLH
jgi:hypothetical protein